MSIRPGEILGVLGENGAGKSTLLSILAGRVQADSGHILIDGAPKTFNSPRDALRAGVSVAYQHFSLVPTFTVREQLRLAGRTSAILPDLLVSRFTGDELIGRLSLGERQLVEIAKALVSHPRVLLLDEPTSILTSAEARSLFDIMRDLRRQGTSVVMVTHKLREATEVCDRIVVLRRGRAVDALERSHGSWPGDIEARLLSSMFDQAAEVTRATFLPAVPRHADHDLDGDHTNAEPRSLFHLQRVSTTPGHGRPALHGVSFDVNEGEICAIVGVDGQGQRELAEVCAGYSDARGALILRGRPLPMGNIREFSQAGIAYLTDDRMEVGTVPGFAVEDNLLLKRQHDWPFSRYGRLRRRAIREYARAQIARWQIAPPDPTATIGTLSGGNIQKVLLARELALATSLLIANKPSHGLDAQTRHLVWQALGRFVDARGGVLLLTSDVDEALAHAHRVGVMYDGRVSPLLPVTAGIRSAVERMMVTGW